MMMYGYGNGVGWGGWVLMALVMAAFWGLVVYALLALFRSASTAGTGRDDAAADPRSILDERLARGEIELDDYEVLSGALPEVPNRGRRGGFRPGARPS